MIFIYKILTFFLFPIFTFIIYLRKYFHKEDKLRFKEKISIVETYFPKDKEVFWFHAASIGETNSALPLIEKLIKDNENVFILLTSTTLSSSKLIEKKKFNQSCFQHRFFPLDVQFLIKKFLNHWKPKIVVFIDSEIWPNFLLEISKRKIPLVLLNGRITEKTFKRWKIFPFSSKKLFGLYNLCLSSSKESEKNLRSLGAKNVKFIGNLKFCSRVNHPKDSIDLKNIFNNHSLWCAASTHSGEEEIILKTHIQLKSKGINVVTIIIPRHIARSKNILKMCNDYKLNSQIVKKYHEISKENEVLIINTIGEMIYYFNNCNSVFVGKSFSKKLIKVGGQNPIEPVKCGCKIYHGPYVSNFKEIFSFLNQKKIAYEVVNENDLSENLFKDFTSNNTSNREHIAEINNYGEKILTLTTKEVLKIKNEI